MTGSIVIHEDRSALWTTINRPEHLNALTPEVVAGINVACDRIDKDHTLRALVITGAPGSKAETFSVGMDINFLSKCFADIDGVFVPFLTSVHEMLLRLESLPVPVIAAVNGFARAGGFEILLSADIVVIAEEARIGDLHLSNGVPPGGGASFRSISKMGRIRAKSLLLMAEKLSGAEAVIAGLATYSVPRAELVDKVNWVVDSIKKSPRNVIAVTKKMFVATDGKSSAESWRIEMELIRDFLLNDPKASEGFNAFREKRSPEWL